MSEPTIFKLPGSLVHANAGALLDEFKARAGTPLNVDASDVEFLGGQCLQVLVAASRKWADDGAGFEIVEQSEAFCEGLSRLGLDIEEFSAGGVAQ
ncbi:MAG: STAS domain-containing protein [Parvularcula sp.]